SKVMLQKQMLMFGLIIAAFVWFGFGLSLYSTTAGGTDPTTSIEELFFTSVFYDCSFWMLTPLVLFPVYLLPLEAANRQARTTFFGIAYGGSRIFGGIGIQLSILSTTFLSTVWLVIPNVIIAIVTLDCVRRFSPTIRPAQPTLQEIDDRTS